MPVNDFEKQVQQKMDELKFAPSTEVWTEVEKRIRKEKKRRRIIFWWLMPAMMLGGGAIYFIINKDTKITIAKQEQPAQKQKESNHLTDPATSVSTKDEVALKKSIQPDVSIDGSAVRKILTENDPPNFQKVTTAEINVTNAGTKKKKKQTTDQNEVGKPIKEEAIIVDAIIKEKEQSIVDTVQVVVAINSKPIQNENGAGEQKDSAISIRDEERREVEELKAETDEKAISSKGKNKKKWEKGFGLQLGSSNTVEGKLFGGMMAFDASPLQNTGGTGSYNGPPVYLSSPKNGSSFGFDFFIQNSITKKLDLRISAQYNYLSTKIRTGSRVDSSRLVNNSLSDQKSIESFYRPPSGSNADRPYTNRYHMAALSATLSWKIINGKKFSLAWDNSLAVNQLLATNALHYDRDLLAFYNDFRPFRKTQLFIGTGLSIPLLKKDKFSISLNPFVQYALRPVLKKDNGPDYHFVNSGVSLKFLFPSKK